MTAKPRPRGRKKKADAVIRSIRFPGPIYARLKATADNQGLDVTSALIVILYNALNGDAKNT